VLLDENLDWRLSKDLPSHEVDSVPRLGWAGIKNGELLRRAEESYDVLLTMDTGMPSQQNVSKLNLAVIVLRAPSNRLADTRALMPEVLRLLPLIKPGTVTVVPQT
jgi:hypothetical protein